jgi:hypothetical protein
MAMTALPRELRARCEAVTKKLSDPKIAGADERNVRLEAKRIIDEIETFKAMRAELRRPAGKAYSSDASPPA